MRQYERKKSEADDRGTRPGREYFRTKIGETGGAGSTGENEPSGLSTENPAKNKLRL